MKYLLLSLACLLLSPPVLAEDLSCKLICVPVRKHVVTVKRKRKKNPYIVLPKRHIPEEFEKPINPVYKEPKEEGIVDLDDDKQELPVIKVVTKENPIKPVYSVIQEKEPSVILGGFSSLGLSTLHPYVYGLAGPRIHFKKAHLGLQGYILSDNGYGVNGLIYTYQGKKVSHNFNIGGLYNQGNPYYNKNIIRSWDITFGTGLQFPVQKHVDIILDVVFSYPDPTKVNNIRNSTFGLTSCDCYCDGPGNNTNNNIIDPTSPSSFILSGILQLGVYIHN